METLRNKKNSHIKTYVIQGDPVALARARFARGSVYDPQKNLKFITSLMLKNQHGDLDFHRGPLHLTVTFFMGIARHTKRPYYHHIYRPDLDNLIKWINDISNNILFEDDCTVSKITATKVYDETPRTEFYFEVLE